MNRENCEKVIQIINDTSTITSTKMNGNVLVNLFDSAKAGNEMAFIFLAEWFFKHSGQRKPTSPFEAALYETLKPYFEI